MKRYAWLGAALTASFLIVLALSVFSPFASQWIRAEAQASRRVPPSTIAAQVYQQHPDFPLENQYISEETGSVATENTLVDRFIRYHLYVKRRPTNFRLDWKLTMADYLGAFDRMSPERYSDYGLRDNPFADDIAAIERMTAEERDRFVNAIYETYVAAE
ncbi:MAG: hypothetical protein AAFP20_05665 [Cyanobacteria bacterium J06614_10]